MIWQELEGELTGLDARHLRRELKVLRTDPEFPVEVVLSDGRRAISFSSNDYLGFRHHPEVIKAAHLALAEYGAGAGASRLIAGNFPIQEALEVRLAEWKGCEAALVFSSGYLASLGLMQVLSHPGDQPVPVFFDKLSHACIVDGATARSRKWRSFRHNDVESLGLLLAKVQPRNRGYSAVVATEGMFSMDGDLAPLPDLAALCEKYNALLVVDDAHGSGTLGPDGRGAVAHWGLSNHPHIVHLGTLSKALGSQGGFVAGPRVVIDSLISRARSFIFDTGLAPVCAAAALEALNLLDRDPEPLQRLTNNCVLFRQLIECEPAQPTTPIVPIHVGAAIDALRLAERLLDKGCLVVPIRPPTVPLNSSRLRVALSSLHRHDQIEAFALALKDSFSQ